MWNKGDIANTNVEAVGLRSRLAVWEMHIGVAVKDYFAANKVNHILEIIISIFERIAFEEPRHRYCDGGQRSTSLFNNSV